VPATELGFFWYEGASGTYLLFWRDPDGSYRRFAVLVLGSLTQWDREEGLVTGTLSPERALALDRGASREEMRDFTRDPKPDFGKLHVAKTVMLGSNLPKDLAGFCARCMRLD